MLLKPPGRDTTRGTRYQHSAIPVRALFTFQECYE